MGFLRGFLGMGRGLWGNEEGAVLLGSCCLDHYSYYSTKPPKSKSSRLDLQDFHPKILYKVI